MSNEMPSEISSDSLLTVVLMRGLSEFFEEVRWEGDDYRMSLVCAYPRDVDKWPTSWRIEERVEDFERETFDADWRLKVPLLRRAEERLAKMIHDFEGMGGRRDWPSHRLGDSLDCLYSEFRFVQFSYHESDRMFCYRVTAASPKSDSTLRGGVSASASNALVLGLEIIRQIGVLRDASDERLGLIEGS